MITTDITRSTDRRRSNGFENEPVALRIGDWTLDLGDSRLKRDNVERRLDPLELGVLLHLAEHAPRTVTAEQLLERNWPGVVVGDGAVHKVISTLSARCESGDPNWPTID